MKETDRQLPSQLIRPKVTKPFIVWGALCPYNLLPESMKAEDKQKAVEMYEAGWSMTSIRCSCGEDAVYYKIKRWRWKLSKGIELIDDKPRTEKTKQICERPNCVRVAIGEFEDKEYCGHCLKKRKKKARIALKHPNRKKGKKTKKEKLSWKKRVFASWKDTPEQAAFRRSPEYQQWRIIVLERDKCTCQHCEQTGGRLVVHHVKTFKMNPELRLKPDNGIVLCNNCHEKLHLSRVKQPKILKFA